MSRSLAFVGILTIIGAAGTWSAVGQNVSDQPTTVVKTHMSDAERDRLMQEAMDKARSELETKKAEEASAAAKAAAREKKKEESRLSAEAAADKIAQEKQSIEATDAEKRKAEEVRMAKELADKEKASTVDTSKNELAPLTAVTKSVDLDEVKKTTAEKAPAEKKPEPVAKKTVTSEKKVVVSEKPSEKKAVEIDRKDSKGSDEQSETAKKTVVEIIPTKEPGANLTVKASASKSGEVKDVEREVSFHGGSSSRPSSGEAKRNGESMTVSGAVVGLMRSTDSAPRILVRDEQGRMVQVVMEEEGADIPAAGARVTVRGEAIGEGAGGKVISSRSVSLESGTTLKTRTESVAVTRGPVPMAVPPPLPMMGPPMGMMPPPMIMGGPMMGPPPPF